MSLAGRTFTFNDVITFTDIPQFYLMTTSPDDSPIISIPDAQIDNIMGFNAVSQEVTQDQDAILYFTADGQQTLLYLGTWLDSSYKSITFLYEPPIVYPSLQAFETWLLANATEVVGASPLSEFEAPDGREYYFKDAQARTDIADLKDNQYSSSSAFPASGEVGKIYIAKDTNETYRWDSTTSDYVLIGSAGGGGSLLYILSFSILTTDWESITGGYGASITDSHVGTATDEIVVFDDSLTDLNANIFWEKNGSTHTMTFTSSSIPSDTISGKVFVFGDASGDVAYALPAVTSSDNGKVLGVVDGAWAVMTIPSANGVSF